MEAKTLDCVLGDADTKMDFFVFHEDSIADCAYNCNPSVWCRPLFLRVEGVSE